MKFVSILLFHVFPFCLFHPIIEYGLCLGVKISSKRVMVNIAAVSHCTTLASYTTTWWLLQEALWTGNMDDKTCVIAGQVVDFV